MPTKEEIDKLYEKSIDTKLQEDFDNLQINVLKYLIQELWKLKDLFGKEGFSEFAENLREFEFKFIMWEKYSADEDSWLDEAVKEMFWTFSNKKITLQKLEKIIQEADALLWGYYSRRNKRLSLRKLRTYISSKPVTAKETKVKQTKLTDVKPRP